MQAGYVGGDCAVTLRVFEVAVFADAAGQRIGDIALFAVKCCKIVLQTLGVLNTDCVVDFSVVRGTLHAVRVLPGAVAC